MDRVGIRVRIRKNGVQSIVQGNVIWEEDTVRTYGDIDTVVVSMRVMGFASDE